MFSLIGSSRHIDGLSAVESAVEFSENLDQIKKFEETNCDTTCSKGFIVKINPYFESGTIFSEQVPKSSCENFLTMQLVKELFAASKRDYTEVSL